MEMIITIPYFSFINPYFLKTNDYPTKFFVSFKNYYFYLKQTTLTLRLGEQNRPQIEKNGWLGILSYILFIIMGIPYSVEKY